MSKAENASTHAPVLISPFLLRAQSGAYKKAKVEHMWVAIVESGWIRILDTQIWVLTLPPWASHKLSAYTTSQGCYED